MNAPPVWAEDLQYGRQRRNTISSKGNRSCAEMKGQFVRFVTLSCSPPHPEAFFLLTPAPKNCHADPLQVFTSQLCLRATARSHFHCHTPLPGRRVHTESAHVRLCVAELCSCLHACLHSYLSSLCCLCHVHIFAFSEKAAKGNMWMAE